MSASPLNGGVQNKEKTKLAHMVRNKMTAASRPDCEHATLVARSVGRHTAQANRTIKQANGAVQLIGSSAKMSKRNQRESEPGQDAERVKRAPQESARHVKVAED
jgi:hypothetical protein